MTAPRPHPVRPGWIQAGLALALLAAAATPARALGLIDQVRQTEFVFDRAANNAPFPALGILDAEYYPHGELALASGPVTFGERVWSEGCILPVAVWSRDILLAGQYFTWTDLDVSSPRPIHGQVSTFMPVLGWAHQFDRENQGGVFFAPSFSRGHNFPGFQLTATQSYSGAVGLHWTSDRLAWLYGLVYQHANGKGVFLPYAGMFWQPNDVWSVSLVVPWPAVAWAQTKDFYLRFGLTPAGAAFDRGIDGRHVAITHTSWNLMLSPSWRVWRSVWVMAGAGYSNFGNLTVTTDGHVTLASKLARRPVWQLQFSFKP